MRSESEHFGDPRQKHRHPFPGRSSLKFLTNKALLTKYCLATVRVFDNMDRLILDSLEHNNSQVSRIRHFIRDYPYGPVGDRSQ